MKKYIQPKIYPILLQMEGHLAASGLETSSGIGDEEDYARKKRGIWSSELWNTEEEAQ